MANKHQIYKMRFHQGFSLIELMVSIILGLMVILAVGNIFLAGRKTINSTEAVGRTQETAGIAFELMGRDLREAGGNPCSSDVQIGSTLNSYNTAWWTDWKNGIKGYEAGVAAPGTASGSGVGQRIANTDAVDIFSAFDGDTNVVTKMPEASAEIEVETSASFTNNDIVLVCDTEAAFIFQVTQVNGSGTKLQHNSGSGSPGNCSKVFSYTDLCNNAATGYLFDSDAMVARLGTYRWYVGNNSNGGRSLYRLRLSNIGMSNIPSVTETVEVVQNVQDMNITYFVRGNDNYVDASAVADWKQVTAVRVVVTMQTATNNVEVGMDGQGRQLSRQMSQTVALRNR